MNRLEFERRWEAMPHLKKAELIKGVVYMPPAAIRLDQHGGPHFDIIGWLALYRAATPGIRGGDNASLRLDMENEPQPDAFLMIDPRYGGRARIDPDGYVTKGPELAAEIAASSVSYDLHDKLDIYRLHGVQEYLVWRVFDKAIDWFELRRGAYRLLPCEEGIYRSRVFPGLWLDVQAMLLGDLAQVAEISRQGLATEEHTVYSARLQKNAERRSRRGKRPKS